MEYCSRINPSVLLKSIVHQAILLLMLLGMFSSVDAQEYDERRMSVGIKLFPAVLAADRKIANKTEQGFLRVLLIYDDDRLHADRIASALYEIQNIKGMPIAIDVRHHNELASAHDHTYAAIFVAQNLFHNTAKVVKLGIEKNIITFSPIKGDVESGIASGFFVSDQSRIELKSFFVKVAKHFPGDN